MDGEEALGTLLQLAPGSRMAVVGCGGKTSIIKLLAKEVGGARSVLVAPTTQIGMPQDGNPVLLGDEAARAHTPLPGVQYAGIPRADVGKLRSLSPPILAEIENRYDCVLMEADGSRNLPAKGWAAYEPVVPPFATHTVGVISLAALGKPATEETVHRLDAFSCLTGLAAGDTITHAALADMASEAGMFKNAQGNRVLVINQVEGAGDAVGAQILMRNVLQRHPGAVHRFIWGSAHQNRWQLAWEQPEG